MSPINDFNVTTNVIFTFFQALAFPVLIMFVAFLFHRFLRRIVDFAETVNVDVNTFALKIKILNQELNLKATKWNDLTNQLLDATTTEEKETIIFQIVCETHNVNELFIFGRELFSDDQMKKIEGLNDFQNILNKKSLDEIVKKPAKNQNVNSDFTDPLPKHHNAITP